MELKLAYKTSRDMKRLKELLDLCYEVICLYTYDFAECRKGKKGYEPMMTTDLCTAKLVNRGSIYEYYTMSCRGSGFLDYFTRDMPYEYSFLELLESRDIQFIEPDMK